MPPDHPITSGEGTYPSLAGQHFLWLSQPLAPGWTRDPSQATEVLSFCWGSSTDWVRTWSSWRLCLPPLRGEPAQEQSRHIESQSGGREGDPGDITEHLDPAGPEAKHLWDLSVTRTNEIALHAEPV